PRFTPTMGVPDFATTRAAARKVPSPPSTMTNSSFRAPNSSRETQGAPFACTALSGSTTTSNSCAHSQSKSPGIIWATSGLLGLEKMPTALLNEAFCTMLRLELYRKAGNTLRGAIVKKQRTEEILCYLPRPELGNQSPRCYAGQAMPPFFVLSRQPHPE